MKLVSLSFIHTSYWRGQVFNDNLAWFCVLWISVLVARRLWRATHRPVAVAVPTPKRKTPRPLKPRTPKDCPVCGRPHPTPLLGNVRKAGVLPWRERKCARGKPKTICTAGYACPRPECDYFGNTDSTFHALVGEGKRGADGIQWLRCQACGKRFSSRRGTALYHLRTPAAHVALVLLAVNLGLTIADAQLLFGHSEVTIRLWITRAGEQAEKVHAHFFRNLTLGPLQLDELFTTLRDKAHDLWVWVAFDPATKLIPALQLGPRTQHIAYALLHAVTLVLAPGCLPVFTSDGLDLYFYAITAHFGQWITDVTTGQTRWQVALDLLYGQVNKSYRRRRLARVERINLTLRHALAALSRRSWATAQLTGELLAHLEWWRAYYHFCRPHLSLRLKVVAPLAPRGQSTRRRSGARTPAMAAGLTDHIWSVQELLAFPGGP
jgi:IS1 family transposase/transposase-like protein